MTLEEIAKKMCAKGKGILAADESTGTIAKRFKSINVENTEKNRSVFRQTLFSSKSMKNYIGGVILFDETIKQKTTLGITIPELITKNELSHLVVDGASNRPTFLNDIFYHEDSFPFLIKVYDSKDDGYNYHVKIFRIDYEKFIPKNEIVMIP